MTDTSLRGDTTRTRYSEVAMALHWAIAVLILLNFLLAYWAGWLEDHAHDPSAMNPQGLEALMRAFTRPQLLNLHKPIGILVLLFSLFRLGWRLVTPQPPFAAHLKPWESMLAHAVHWTFYVAMIGMPMAGWAMVSASRRYAMNPVNFFGIHLPAFPGVPATRPAHELLEEIHTDWLPWLFWVLLALHVLGALKHQFIDKDGEFGRMIPWLREPGPRSDAA